MKRETKLSSESRYFDPSMTSRERAVFEAGISLGSICHQFVGTPVADRREVLTALEKAIETTMSLQPYKERVQVRIRPTRGKPRRRHYGYELLSDRMLNVRVAVNYSGVEVHARMRHIKNLDYPLMFVEKIIEH